MFLIAMMIFCGQLVQNADIDGNYNIKFVEDLRFGAEEGENYEWFDGQTPVMLDVDSRGHVYVIDMKEARIIEFDEKGAFIRFVGKRGEGPGEFQNLAAFKIMKDGTAIGRDNLQALSKFYYFDKDMKYLETKMVQDLTRKGGWKTGAHGKGSVLKPQRPGHVFKDRAT